MSTMTLSEHIREACGREGPIEDVVEALARKGGFDNLLPGGSTRVAVKRGRRGHADVEIMASLVNMALGIEVKLGSRVNWAKYGRESQTSQFDQMAAHVDRLLILTTPARWSAESWPAGAEFFSLESLADLAKAYGLTYDDVAAVAFGHAA